MVVVLLMLPSYETQYSFPIFYTRAVPSLPGGSEYLTSFCGTYSPLFRNSLATCHTHWYAALVDIDGNHSESSSHRYLSFPLWWRSLLSSLGIQRFARPRPCNAGNGFGFKGNLSFTSVIDSLALPQIWGMGDTGGVNVICVVGWGRWNNRYRCRQGGGGVFQVVEGDLDRCIESPCRRMCGSFDVGCDVPR